MKKLVTIILALAMILAMSIPALAANDTYTLTITGTAGHTYDIYQIYTGNISQEDDKTVLSNVKYGANHYPVDGGVGDAVPADELEALVNSNDPTGILDSAVKGTPYKDNVSAAQGESTIVIENLPAGYYMIVDVTTNLPDGQTKSPIILQVLESVTIASKHASIVSEKKVDDKNDSNTTEDAVVWQDSADYDIGDAVPFQLSVTIPSTLGSYDSYELTFHDKMDVGFAAPVMQRVYILQANGNEIDIPAATATTSGYTVHDGCPTRATCEFGGCNGAVTVGDIKALYGNTAFINGDKLIVEYTAVLDTDANVGRTGNENGMYVCHPDGHTPKDDVTVLTYQLKVNKIDGATKEALEGAGFTLYKWSAKDNDWAAVGDEIKNVTSFVWSGIDGGNYKLVETTTPTGYNTIADMLFVVDSNHKAEWVKGGNSAFNDVIAKDAEGKVVFADAAGEDAVEDGKLEGDIENYKGTILPETGAKGTMMLIGGGALLVMMASVFMVTRKKMSIYEDEI